MDKSIDSLTGASTYLNIRGDIIFGGLPPGSKLTLAPLRERYGASVPTLREVLNRLTSEGFVVSEDLKGFQVAPVSIKGLKEIASLRELLESSGLQDSLKAGDVEWESDVLAAHHRLSSIEGAMIRGEKVNVRTWKQCDRQFHAALIAACGSDFLVRTYNSVFDHYLRYQMLALGFRGESAALEHRQLLEAALARDVNKALEVLHVHIAEGVKQAIATGPLSKSLAR
ncbi:FCD domain-containing protein [Rhizobium sp. M1]|uniref:GntR family transcriptional regulator n=1 Tax=Rhizobium sp. M1 TaxID=2035453 RepID=UPI000BEA7164|nr:FCD domain-containing protein [Rhizobium sp. M1]PDT08224.1 GntR family transcriptional regulator [Rhizobium sp. M1]